MVVCKCRKATKLYCFVHKVPVCGECICLPEHQLCVVRKYSDWVVDGDYDWPPTCYLCQTALEAGSDSQTTRLGCLHIMHTSCLVPHIQRIPPQTAPSGYVCPACASPIWPPNDIKDTGSRFHSKLKEAMMQSGLERNFFGNHLVSMHTVESHVTPALASDPLVQLSDIEQRDKSSTNSTMKDPRLASSSLAEEGENSEKYSSTIRMGSSKLSEPDIVEVDGPSSMGNQDMSDQDSTCMKNMSSLGPGATTRKSTYQSDRQYFEISYNQDDEDGTRKKYTRRGPFRHKLLRLLLPFWSSALPILPVTAPPRKNGDTTDNVSEGRLRHHRASRIDPRKILLTIAVMACVVTMGVLYYRLAQRSLGGNMLEDEPH